MKLSDAIRLGSKLTPQAWSRLKSKHGGTCALGAALEGIEYDFDISIKDTFESYWSKLIKAAEYIDGRWPEVINTVVLCPLCPEKSGFLTETITHLNDDHRVTRERIAEWIDSLTEKKEEKVQMANATAV